MREYCGVSEFGDKTTRNDEKDRWMSNDEGSCRGMNGVKRKNKQ